MRSTWIAASIALVACLCGLACGKRIVVPPGTPFPAKARWEATLDAPLASAPVSDGTAFFAALSTGSVIALESASGRILWTRTGLSPGFVVARKDALLLVEKSGMVWGLDPADGSARWKRATRVTDVRSVRLDGNRVFLGGGSGLACVTASNGETRFDVEAKDVRDIDVAGDFLAAIEGEALVERAREGAAVIFRVESPEREFGAPAVFSDGRIVVGSGTRLVRAISRKGRFGWRFKVGARMKDRPLDFGDLKRVGVVSFEGVFYELSLGGGDMRRRVLLSSRPFGPPILDGSRILAPISEDEVSVIDAKLTKLIGRTRLGGGFLSPPFLSASRVVAEISGPRRLVGLELAPQ